MIKKLFAIVLLLPCCALVLRAQDRNISGADIWVMQRGHLHLKNDR